MILIIGGTGRLGRPLANDLAAEHEVRVLARHATSADSSRSERVELIDGDIRDSFAVAEAADGASCIVMAAHGVESRDRDGLEAVDELGSRAVVAAARRFGSRIVLVSSATARLDSPLRLDRSKWAAERVIRESGTSWTIVRAAPYAQTWAMILTMSAGRSERPGIIGAGEPPHRFVDVRDVVAAVARAATDVSLHGRTLEVAGPEELTLGELAAMMQRANSWPGSPRHIPMPVARAIGGALELFRPDLARRVRIAVAMNAPDPAPDGEAEVPSWITTRSITPETMGAVSRAVHPRSS